MAKQKRVPKPRKYCCFCDGSDLSKEHIWAEWMAEYLPPGEGHHYAVVRDGGGLRPGGNVETFWSRQGAVHTVCVRAVCRRCNNGWMSRLEISVRTHLEPMLKGEQVNLDLESQALLAKYFVMKAMVLDRNRSPHVFTKEERAAFYSESKIPDRVNVMLMHYPVSFDDVRASNKEFLKYENAAGNFGVHGNFTLRLNSLFIHVLVLQAFPLNGFLNERALQIYPAPPEKGVWPPELSLSPMDARTTQHLLERNFGHLPTKAISDS